MQLLRALAVAERGGFRRLLLWSAVVFAVAMIPRLGLIFFYLDDPPASERPAEPVSAALSLLETGRLADPFAAPTGYTAHLSPAHPLLLSVLYRIFGTGTAGEKARQVYQCFWGALKHALMPLAAVSLGLPAGTGVLAGLLGALMPGEMRFETRTQAEAPLAAFALTAAVIWTCRISFPAGAASRALLLGAGWGAAMLINPAVAPIFAALAALQWWEAAPGRRANAVRNAALAAAAAAVTLLPWAVRNQIRLGEMVWTRTNLGIEFSLSHSEDSHLTLAQHHHHGVHARRHPQVNEGQARRVRKLGEVAYNRILMDEALAYIRDHPLVFLERTAKRAALFWFPDALTAAFRYPLWAVSLLGFAGLALLARERPAAARRMAAIWLSYPWIYYLVQADERYRYPILWSSTLCACWLLWRRVHHPKKT